jgi:lipopolysaccharide/colanic/teichoic acid biosynthesis glycosyltransferase
VIGIIRPLTHLQPQEAAIILTETVQRELLRSLRSQEAGHCSIRLEVHSASSQTVTTARPANGRAEQARSVVRDVLKRLLDIAGSAALLALLSPVFLVIAALIKVSSKGPVLFRQPRVGQCGRRFTMFKFRTMHVNADEAVHQQYVARFIESGATATATSDKVFKIVDDPRVTPLGHFLRRSSLDELPQFWNVFRGEMSLVGPRPPLAYEVQRYKRWHLRRLWEAKPGITGLWQVKGRSRTTFDEMVRLDLQYAKTHSLWTDIKILLATPLAVVSGKGAH